MRKNRTYIIGIVLLVLVTMYFLFGNRKQSVQWRETYLHENKNPYDTKLSYGLLRMYFDDEPVTVLEKKLEQSLPKKTRDEASYVFIGTGIWLDSLDMESLTNFVDQGNTAFIASKAIPDDLIYKLFGGDYLCEDYWDNYYAKTRIEANFNLNHPSADLDSALMRFKAYGRDRFYNWNFIDGAYLCGNENNGFLPLGTVHDSLTNFVRLTYGSGQFYFHTNPIAFSNISLLDDNMRTYVMEVFNHLPRGKIYWDAHNNVPEYAVNPTASNNNRLSRENPLQYILSQPALTWAWYTLLGLGLLYLWFRSKRRQRVIPITEKNENTSLEFLSTIGRLHFIRNSHKQLANEKNKLFHSFIRRRYQIQGQELDEKAVERLVIKSQIPKDTIRKIILLANNIDNSTFVSENTLIDFHQALDDFYKNCK